LKKFLAYVYLAFVLILVGFVVYGITAPHLRSLFKVFQGEHGEMGGRVTVRDNGVVIVDQFYENDPSFTEEMTKLIESLGYKVQVFKGEDVTVDFYKTLPKLGAGLYILRVHAGVLNTSMETYLFTSEEYNQIDHWVEQLTGQVAKGFANPISEENPVFAVGPAFVEMSMEGDFRGATVILSSCLGLYDPRLAEAFVKKGVRVFISWDEKVSLSHTDKAVLRLVELLLADRVTVKEAVSKVMEEVGVELEYGAVLRFYPSDRGDLRIV